MRKCNVTLGGLFPLLMAEMLPITIVIEEADEQPVKSCSCSSRCNCKKSNWDMPLFNKKACMDNPFEGEGKGICLGARNYYQTNYNDPNFNESNDWGEPSPVMKRSFEEIAEQERHPEPDGINVNVLKPKRTMFSTHKAFASAASKYRMLEDLAHSCNWGGAKNHTPIFTDWDD